MKHQEGDKDSFARASPEARSLLIVDDDQPFRQRLARAMERRGFTVTTAATAEEAMALIADSPPAYAVVDLRLEEGYGGSTLCRSCGSGARTCAS